MQTMVQRMTQIPVCPVPSSPQSWSCSSQSSQPGRMRSRLWQGCPGMRHRARTWRESISYITSRVLWIADQDSWESKLHILEQMASLCTIDYRWGWSTSAQIPAGTGRGKGRGRGRRRRRAEVLGSSQGAEETCVSPTVNESANRCLSQRWERLKYILMLSLGNQWFLHIAQV